MTETTRQQHRPPHKWLLPVLRFTGAGLLVAASAMHLDLYLTGYRSLPTIGWLFLLQVITGFVLAAAVLVTRHPLAAAAAAGFAVATLGGYLLSVWIGLFGFKEVRTTAGIVVGVLEVAAFAALALVAILPGPAYWPRLAGIAGRMLALVQARARVLVPAVAAASALALVLLGVAVANAGGPPAAAAGATVTLRTAKIGGVTVLTNGKGLTLYRFAIDSPTTSRCNGSCAAYWSPVVGNPKAGPGVTGTLGTIKRADGATQATYNGHPLYTYVGDNAPGQARGNNINLNGGFWYDIHVSG